MPKVRRTANSWSMSSRQTAMLMLCAMPDAVLNAYRRVLPKKRQAQLLEDVAEETDSEARTVEESDLFQNQTYTMAASEIKDNREGGDE